LNLTAEKILDAITVEDTLSMWGGHNLCPTHFSLRSATQRLTTLNRTIVLNMKLIVRMLTQVVPN
jgi:hypothetical protein